MSDTFDAEQTGSDDDVSFDAPSNFDITELDADVDFDSTA